ncbi:hypothetical protein ACFVU2_18940 [Leifsonia sp. NPDC058194]|uniref:hypothetical protein n=1 Tax=Leifsonia sp. NPDC058194 TaxID=3346374 RepID=UPI0036DA1F8C
MRTATYYPLTLTEQPVTSPDRRGKPATTFITVRVTMPHVQKYGKNPTMLLAYACSFAVKVGDPVLCPPTRLNPKWTRGIVTQLTAGSYRGPVKYVAALGKKKG